jgi:peptidoglycan hydrolase-like protein with peptidoglycan-binding domain
MSKIQFAAALLALGGLATLPACSPAYTRTSYAAPAPANPAVSSALVTQVQTALQQQGNYAGAIDGIWGPQTQAAVQSFQQSHSLTATGQLDSPTLEALNLPAGNAVPSAQSSATAPPDNTSAAAPNTTTTTPATPGPAPSSTAPATTPPP